MPGAYGARGGIAQYNRDLLTAIAATSSSDQVTVLPRCADEKLLEQLPYGLRQLKAPVNGLSYVIRARQVAASQPSTDIVFCGHLRLAALAAFIARNSRAGLWLQMHGIEAWSSPSWLIRNAVSKADLLTSVSRFTRDKMLSQWATCDPCKTKVLPNTIRSEFSTGPRSSAILEQYNLSGRCVLLSVSRLARTERYKGHDRVIAALPCLRKIVPDLAYLIVGDGDDVGELRNYAKQLGQEDHVRFAGDVSADELLALYRAADVFVMPSTGEGFGIVFLEAAACGLPVIGGKLDGSWDALREGQLGFAIDPRSQEELVAAVIKALNAGPCKRFPEVAVFRRQNFEAHVASLLNRFFPAPYVSPDCIQNA